MGTKKPSVLIVDDEQVVRDLLYNELNDRGYLCTTALDGNDALSKLAAHDFNVTLLDIKLPGLSGMEVLRRIYSAHRDTAAIMMTAVNSVDTAVEAIKLGALDYIVKPFDLDKVNASIRTALKAKNPLTEIRDYETPLYVGGEQENRQAMEKSFGELNAIASGVATKHDLLTGHSKIVTQETIDIARRLGIADEEIQRWAAARARLDSERNGVITSLLNKLERSPFAQSILGLMEQYRHPSNLNESQN